MKLTSYKKYKKSGIEWLGEVPEHWENCRLKDIIILKNGDWIQSQKLDDSKKIPVYGGNGILGYTDQFNVRRKTLIIGRVGAKCGNVHLELSKAWVNDNAIIVKTTSHYKFLFYFLKNAKLNDLSSSTAQPLITGKSILNFSIIKVPLQEQTQIANYLDQQTTRIDKKIVLLTQKIKHYQDLKTALINRAVTKGLDDTVTMKDSGVEWAYKIPENWEVKPLKTIGDAIIGLTYSPSDVCGKDEGTLVLRASNIKGGKIVFGNNVYVKKNIPNKLQTKKNDIIICSRSGSRDLIGKCAIIDKTNESLSFGAFTTVFRSPINHFVFYILNSNIFKAEAGKYMTTTINQLTIRTLKTFLIPIPPIQEQQKIVAYLNKKTTLIDNIITNIQTQIKNYKALRKSLINDVVTGKVRVSEVSELSDNFKLSDN